MRRFIAVVFLFAALPVIAQRAGPFTINATSGPNSCATIRVNAYAAATVGISVTGTFSATLQPETIIASQAAQNTQVYPYGSATSQSTITTVGNFNAQVAGVDSFQLCATAYASGAAIVYFNVSTASARGPSSGGGTGGSGAGAGVVSAVGANPVTIGTAATDIKVAELPLPAGYLNFANQVANISARGFYTTVAAQTPTITEKLKLCSVSGCGSGTVIVLYASPASGATTASVSNTFDLDATLSTTATGASGTVLAKASTDIVLGATGGTSFATPTPTVLGDWFVDASTTSSSAIDLTQAWFLDLMFNLSTGTTNTITPSAFTIFGGGVAAPVGSVSNSDGSLLVTPTTGAVVASLNPGHANTWSATQTFGTNISIGGVTPTGATGTGNLVFATSPSLSSPTLTGTPDASGATQFKLPVGASFATLANGEVGYDTTNKNWHLWQNGVDVLLAPLAAGFVSGHCGQPTSTAGVWQIADAGAGCGTGGGSVSGQVKGQSTIGLTPTTVGSSPSALYVSTFCGATSANGFTTCPSVTDESFAIQAAVTQLINGGSNNASGYIVDDMCGLQTWSEQPLANFQGTFVDAHNCSVTNAHVISLDGVSTITIPTQSTMVGFGKTGTPLNPGGTYFRACNPNDNNCVNGGFIVQNATVSSTTVTGALMTIQVAGTPFSTTTTAVNAVQQYRLLYIAGSTTQPTNNGAWTVASVVQATAPQKFNVNVVSGTTLSCTPGTCGTVFLDTPMFALGSGGGVRAGGVTALNFTADCNFVIGCGGLVNAQAQEHSGYQNVQVYNADTYYWRFDQSCAYGGISTCVGNTNSGPYGPLAGNIQSELCTKTGGCACVNGTGSGTNGGVSNVCTSGLVAVGASVSCGAGSASGTVPAVLAVDACDNPNFVGNLLTGSVGNQGFGPIDHVTVSISDPSVGGGTPVPGLRGETHGETGSTAATTGVATFVGGIHVSDLIDYHPEFFTIGAQVCGNASKNATWAEAYSSVLTSGVLFDGGFWAYNSGGVGIDIGQTGGNLTNCQSIHFRGQNIGNGTNSLSDNVNANTCNDAVLDYSIGNSTNPVLKNSCTTGTGPEISTISLGKIDDLTNQHSVIIPFGVASAVDQVTVTNAATANPATVSVSATGSDTNINLNLISKGTGAVECNGSPCGTGGTITGQVVGQIPLPGSSTSITNTLTAGTNQGYYLPERVNTVNGTAGSLSETQLGDCAAPGTITGAATTYTIAYTDSVGCNVVHDIAGSAGATITIPTPTTLNNAHPFFKYTNNTSAQTDTLSPTTFQISMGNAAAASTLSVPPGAACLVQLDPVNASTWKADCHLIAVTSGTTTVASGTSTMGTGAITSGTCASAVTTTATGVATTDSIIATPNTDPTAVTGYAPSASGSLYIQAYPTSGNVNFKVCNNTSGSITPSALTLNWRVVR